MKAAMNGVLNLSILDGWWPEGCINGVHGWQIGDGTQGEGEEQNDRDRDFLYKALFDEVMPAWYQHPATWESMMRMSVQMATDRFSAARMLRDYYETMYQAAPEEPVKTQA